MKNARIGVLGSGEVGRTLAGGFLSLGHDVMIGSRDPQKLQPWADAAGTRGSNGTFEETARFGDILLLATLGTATLDVIRLAGIENFASKVVIDATNPLDFSSGAPRLAVGHSDSLGESIQRTIPRARVVKCFNTVGHAHMINPQFAGGPPTMFFCGDDEDAKKIVSQICGHFGWDVADIGGIDGSRYLEPMCMVWVSYGVRAKSWNHAFKLLRR